MDISPEGNTSVASVVGFGSSCRVCHVLFSYTEDWMKLSNVFLLNPTPFICVYYDV